MQGNKATTQNWRATNDPVMGGISQSSVKVADGALSWTGEVKVVPKLHAPGFCTATTGGYEQPKDHFPDLSSTEGLLVTVRNKLSGGLSSFKVNMDTGAGRSGQFEARFNTTVSSNFKTFFVPFTSMTSDYRGRPEGGAPTKAQLGAITGLGLNQDGLAGKFDIELKSITAGSPGGGGGGGGKTLDLVTFAEGDKTNYKWTDLNDPVSKSNSADTHTRTHTHTSVDLLVLLTVLTAVNVPLHAAHRSWEAARPRHSRSRPARASSAASAASCPRSRHPGSATPRPAPPSARRSRMPPPSSTAASRSCSPAPAT